MQNYHQFIDELFRLTIDTVQYFVVDGKVLYDHLPEYYPADTPAERLPGYVSTFMSLDRYDQHQKGNRYADLLIELQRRAVTDLLLLEPAQINRLLPDAKMKCERLTELLKNAMKYQKAWGYDTLDLLPAGFLELRLLSAFTIKNRPEASPHDRFAHHLTDAIMYKRGTLSAFIKQIETTLQIAPTTATTTTQEPEYDLWYVNNDDDYAFNKLKQLARYLPTIESFEERVEWFFEKSRIWELEPGNMGAGKRTVPDPKLFSFRTADGRYVDKDGQSVEVVHWGLNCSNDEERGILHKLYFLRFYLRSQAYYFNKPRFELEQLINQYSTQRQTKRGKRLQLDWVTNEIQERQSIVNEYIDANSNKYNYAVIKKQLQNAAILIEQELEGIPSIRWDVFCLSSQLDPLALLWGLVEYKRFLETSAMESIQHQKAEDDLFDAGIYCQTKNFKSDLSELCDKCKMGRFIEEGIYKQVVFQAQQQKDILTDLQFKEYCEKEIASAQNAMMQANLYRIKHDSGRGFKVNIPNNTFYHIWNKERIRALVEIQQLTPLVLPSSDKPKKERQQRPSTIARDKRLRDLVENYMKVEGKPRPEAMELAAEKEGCRLDTVERALGLRKR